MSVDTIGNFLTIIRNGLKIGKRVVVAPHSRITASIAQILKNEGFVQDFVVEGDVKKVIKVFLRYVNNQSAIHAIERVSSPGRRCYEKVRNLNPVKGNLGVLILSTSQGLMTDKQAKDLSVGGEVLCLVW
jgi:small subunit ribosomal protein S8